MSENIKKALEDIENIFRTTDEALTEWDGVDNLKVPTLVSSLAVKMNWDDRQVREYNVLIRYYIREHRKDEYKIDRGPHGGIVRLANKRDKEKISKAQKEAKQQTKAAVEAAVAALVADKKKQEGVLTFEKSE